MDPAIITLTPANLAASLALLLLASLFVTALVNYYTLSHFKGPFLASFSRLWLFRYECVGRLPAVFQAALQEYGSPARVGPNLLVTDDYELIRHMAAPGSNWGRSTWYNAMKLDPRTDNVFSTRNETLHTELKAKEANAYNGRDNPALEGDVDARILDLLQLIKSKHNAKSMNFAEVSRFFTLDVLSTVAFGRPFGFMKANRDLYDYNKISASFMIFLGLQCNHSFLHGLFSLSWMQALFAPKITDEKGWGPLLAFARKAVAERFADDAKPKKDMLGAFIGKGLSQTQCEVEAFLQIMAGSDSTTDVLRSTVFLLSSSPPAYAKLRAEIDAVALAPDAASIKYPEALKLPYLKACILEALRLFPPLFGLKSKVATKGGDTFKGVYFPEGTEICTCDDAFMRNPTVFGPDAQIYRPDRFLEGDEELRTMRLRAVDCVFGSGKYLCLGRHIAMMELHKTVFALMKTFDFQLADPTKGLDVVHHNVHIVSEINLVATLRPL